SNITLNIKDSMGTAVRNASVTMNGETKTTDKNGAAAFTVKAGKYDVSITHSELDSYNTSVIAYAENQSREIRMTSTLPSQEPAVTGVTGSNVTVYVPNPDDAMIFAANEI
ncbi:MAG: hypothetical protein IJI39_08340, partial [Clostridia bacterium]|nr:hypothetical protein [Clostridia bacterium]